MSDHDTTPTTPRPRRRIWFLAAGVVVLLAAAGTAAYFVITSTPPPTPPDVSVGEGEPALAAAIQEARQRVLKVPRSAPAWGDLGKVFLANELEAESAVCFAQAERLDPRDPRWPYLQGGPLLNRGGAEEAIPHLQRAVDRLGSDSKLTSPPLFLAEAFLSLGRLDEAERQFQAVLARVPGDVRAHYGMGLLAVSRQDWAAARTSFLRCLADPQAQKKASQQLAAVSLRLGDATAANRYRDQADALPKDLEWNDPLAVEYLEHAVRKRSRYRLAEQLETAGRFQEAVVVSQALVKDYPDEYLPRLTLAKNLAQLGDHAAAEQVLRKALDMAPDKAQLHYYLSLVLLMKGQSFGQPVAGDRGPAREVFLEAADEARKVLAITPNFGFAHMTLGLSLKFLGEREGCVDALRRAVLCNPELPELHFYFGEALADVGQKEEARHHLGRALEFGPVKAPWREAATARLQSLKQGK